MYFNILSVLPTEIVVELNNSLIRENIDKGELYCIYPMAVINTILTPSQLERMLRNNEYYYDAKNKYFYLLKDTIETSEGICSFNEQWELCDNGYMYGIDTILCRLSYDLVIYLIDKAIRAVEKGVNCD